MLVDIATNKRREASCVTLIALQGSDGERIIGPGRVAKYLGIERDHDSSAIDNPMFLWIGGLGVDASQVDVRKKKSVPGNCLGYFFLKK